MIVYIGIDLLGIKCVGEMCLGKRGFRNISHLGTQKSALNTDCVCMVKSIYIYTNTQSTDMRIGWDEGGMEEK